MFYRRLYATNLGRGCMLNSEEYYDRLKEVRALRVEKSTMSAREKEINKKLVELSTDLVEYFDMHDISRQSLDGSLFYVNRTPCYSINDDDSFFAWMNESGDIEMCKSFNAKKFGAYYKEKVGNGEELPPGVSVYIKQDVRVRKETV